MSGHTTSCPACGTAGCRAALDNLRSAGLRDLLRPLGPCAECGWCAHTTDFSDYTAATGRCEWCDRLAADRRKWCVFDHLPRPPAMPEDEFRFRATMFVAWKTEPASHLRRSFEVFADFLQERGSAEEVAARADWRPYAAKKHDPKGWWQWTVPAGAGWIALVERGALPPGGWYLDYDRARLTKSMHNGRWFLCWPPGFVRVTAPNHRDPQRWNVTVQAGRVAGRVSSRPVERVWPGGYTTLIRDHDAPRLVVEGGVVREPSERHEDLGQFAEEPTA